AAQTKASTCQRDRVCAATQLPALVAAAGAAQAQLATDSANLQTLQGAVAGTPAVAAAQAALDRAVATLVNLLGSLSNQLVNLPDLTTLLDQLLGALKGAPLLGVKDVGVSLSAVADGASGTATAACSAGSVTLLGTAVVAPTCDALRQQLQSVQGAVSTQLATLAAQLQALPTGAALGGLRTIGLDASLGGAGAQASFLPSLPSPASPAAPSTPSAAPDPRPGVEIPRSLPRTGGTRTLELVALGLLLLVGGW